MKAKALLVALLLAANSQTAPAQKVVLHMKGNQKAEYDVSQLDSINFVEVDSSGKIPSTDPSVTGDAIDITNKSATLVGYATSIRESLANDLRVGFIYCLEGTPNKNNGTQVTVNKNEVAEDGCYMATIENLLSDATYYFRSFVYQSGLWFYGKVKSFVTAGIDVNFTTGDATDITCFSAKVSGSVDVQSPYSTLTYGICYGTTIEPTTNDKTQIAFSNNFTLQLRQLTGGTIYYYRPYAIVDGKTCYGNVQTFRTLDDNVVETGDIDEETLTVTSHLTIGGGAYSSLVLGVCYGTTENPTINDYTVTSDEVDEKNIFSIQLPNIYDAITYYRAYVLIDSIPHYGAVKFIYGADYRSVVAPVNSCDSTKVMQYAIYDDHMGMNYDAYLKDMQSKFTLLLPSDDALRYYYDPASMKSRTPRVIEFKYNSAGSGIPVKLTFKNYKGPYNTYSSFKIENVGTIGIKMPGTTSYTYDEVINRLKDILETHTIKHDRSNPMTRDLEQWATGEATNKPLDEYYLSKNGNAVKVIRDENDPDSIIDVVGGFQIENERLFKRLGLSLEDRDRGILSCGIKEKVYGANSGNGNTFILNAPLVPTYRSVYSIFTDDEDQMPLDFSGTGEEEDEKDKTPYSQFYNLCMAGAHDREIMGCGLVDQKKLTAAQQKSALKKFYIFFDDNGLDYNIQFFNNYRYTIFVPTNDAIRTAIYNGLPTWDEISMYYDAHRKPYIDDETGEPMIDEDTGEIMYSDTLATAEDSLRVKAMITYLTNFVRYHFADNSIFADRSEVSPEEMVTSSYDSELGLFCKIHVDRKNTGNGTVLRVCDDVTWKQAGNLDSGFETLADIDGVDVRNILARDVSCSKKPVKTQANGITINTSSAAVIHSIDGYLNHLELIDGRHDKTYETTIKAKEYLKRFAIR